MTGSGETDDEALRVARDLRRASPASNPRPHRLGGRLRPPVELVVRRQRPGPKGKGRRDGGIARALLALKSCAAIHRFGGGRWRLADPTLRAMLRSARAASADFRLFAS